jgi:tRNA-dihydrouridine synthase B
MGKNLLKTELAFPPAALHIGTVVVDPPVVLAPMAGVTDRWYRRVMAQHGAGLVTTEMISVEGLRRNNKATRLLCAMDPELPAPLAVQLFGARPEALAEGARLMEQSGVALIDINAGCPVRKVARQGAGAVLLKDPDALVRLVEAVRRAVTIPLTVKLRLGWDEQSINVVATAQRLADVGADAITLHARTARQHYAGQADWTWIKRVKEAVAIPVIGNGDVASPAQARQMFTQTGCDGVMIGRGSLGNPWLFAAIATSCGRHPEFDRPFTWEDFERTARRHLESAFAERAERCSGLFRKVLLWYSSGCPGATRLRRQLLELQQPHAMLELFHSAVQDWAARGVPFLSTKINETGPRPKSFLHADNRG